MKKDAPTFSLDTVKIPLEVLKHLLVNKGLHLLDCYLLVTRCPVFGGHLSKGKIGVLAAMLGKSRLTTNRQLEALENMGLLVQKNTVWLSFSANAFASTSGQRRCKFVAYHKNVRQLAFAAVVSEQAKRIGGGKTWREKKQTQDNDDGFNVSISATYTAAYLADLGIKYTPQEISKQRHKAKELGLLDYQRELETLPLNVADLGRIKKNGMSSADNEAPPLDVSGAFVKSDGVVVKELPATFTKVLPFKSRGVSNEQKKRASGFWGVHGK